ncbi:MAG: hypothetical protein H0T79_20090 [Deltaproteobacteria bacterium]|nr:hypothetical protein [Deltaproteobacteria bacterium]
MHRGFLVVGVAGILVACNPKFNRDDRDDRELAAQIGAQAERESARRLAQRLEDELKRQQPIPDPDPVKKLPAPSPLTQPRPSTCVDLGVITSLKMRGTKLRACVDSTSDGDPDQCVMWERASAKLVTVEQIFSVEDDDTPTPLGTPGNPDPDAEDPRITQDGDAVEACPPDRVCIKFMPALADGETIDGMRGDARHRAVAMVMSDSDSKNPRTEVWDLAQGRVRGRAKLTGLEEDIEYGYSMRSFGESFVAIAKRTDNSHAVATLLGLDGARRALLANGSRFVDAEQLIELAPGQLAVLDLAPAGIPYNVFVHSLGSGGTLAKFVIAMDGDGDDDDVQLLKLDRSTLGVAQWSEELRLDLLDVRSSTMRGFTVPGC